ncbi:MarR family winged helix-turn-helix transcriptional regulator [Pseudonocardia phyllosphaerae]|uniref:MarR family winged helix-turn-helix transcriptional regulator n=1 Tax=Pseudonocardia phyllosphaerae TaxID=3390502 RepID=UPI003979C07E
MARLENLLGAYALSVTDELLGPGGTDRAALVTLLAHPGRTVSWLADVLGLTGSGATRLVTRLEREGLVARTAGADTRERRVRLTVPGRERAHAVLDERADSLAARTTRLSSTQRRDLENLLGVLVGEAADTRLPALRTCRLCDRGACTSDGRECPLEHTVDPADPHT